ncbi:MAG TPA: sporulation membrane protein YtaF [Symbiobacteriaceae bacterium]|jgi:putative sporulation protein YtaF
MLVLVHLLLIGIAANLDNLGVGVAYGIRRIKIPALPNLVVAAIAFLFTYVSVVAGAYTGRFISDTAARAIGAVLLIGVGVWVVLAQWRGPKERPASKGDQPNWVLAILQEPERVDADNSGSISLSESLVLGAALSINCFTNGFSAGLWKLGALPTSICTAAFSYLTLWGGAVIGARYAAEWLGSKATVVAGCLLILLGLHQLL